MTGFLKTLFAFLIFNLLLAFCFVSVYVFYYNIGFDDIPAPNLSDSYSYNEKMSFLRKAENKQDIISIGSSMSLNNLHSETITKRFGTESYMNLSSWGMSMKDVYLLFATQSEIHMPKVLIIASGVMDFYEQDKTVKYEILEDYLISEDIYQIYYHLSTFRLKYYIKNFKYAKKVRSCINEYEYLGFDAFGGVNLEGENFQIDQTRWNSDYLGYDSIFSQQYAYLDSISNFCASNKIDFLFFQSPYRQGLYSGLDEVKLTRLKKHFSDVQKIIDKYGHTFVKGQNIDWEDDLFIDGTHFNMEGAKLFSEYCFDEVETNLSLQEFLTLGVLHERKTH